MGKLGGGVFRHVFGIEHFILSLGIHCLPPGHVGPAPKHACGREHTLPADFPSNRVLATLAQGGPLPWPEQLERVELFARQELHAQGAGASHVYFPTSALVVLIQTLAGGAEAPVALVGNDGLVGVAAFMGTGLETNRAVVLQPGWAWRLPASAVHIGGPDGVPLVRAAVGHLLSLTSQISQTAFCQQHHNIEQRLARWLLTALDRLPGQEVAIELPELAPLLGVTAEVLAPVAKRLGAQGALVCEPGRVVVPNCELLRSFSCGCQAHARGMGH